MYTKTSHLNKRTLVALVFDYLLSFDVVGHLAFLVHSPHEEPSSCPVTAAPRNKSVE